MGLFSFFSKLIGGSGPQQKIEISTSSAADGLPIIYGRRRVEAITVFKRVSSDGATTTLGASGADHFALAGAGANDSGITRKNVWLHRIDVWGQGEIQGIKRFWVDGDAITHKRFFPRPYVRTLTKYGSEDQSAYTGLLLPSSGQWGSAHKGNGVAYSWSRFFNSKNKPQFTAEPELKAEIDGLRLYDPRLDSSAGGSGSQSFDDASTWTFSRNRALVALNYMMGSFGFGALRDELDLGSFMVAADLCDRTMDIPLPPTNQTGQIDYCYNPQTGDIDSVAPNGRYPCYRVYQPPTATTQARYRADVVIDPKDGVVENVKRLLEEFGWSLSWSNGRHRLVIEDLVSAAAMTFDANTILGDWDIQRSSRTDRYNRVTVEFPNSNKNYEQDTVSWPPLRGDQHNIYLAADGGRDLHTNISLRTVTDAYRATAFAEYKVRKSRASERISGLNLAPIAMLLEPGDVIALDFPEKGYHVVGNATYENGDAWFIVERVNISATLDVSVDLRTYDPTVYGGTVPEPEQVNYGDQSANPWLDPEAITNLNGVEYHTKKADGSVVSGIYLTWNAPAANVAIDHVEVRWRDAADPDFTEDNYQGMQALPEEATAFRIPNLVDDRIYEVVITYITRLSQRAIEATISVDLSVAPDSKLDLIEEGATRTAFTGPYNAGTAYMRGDVVFYEGASYVALDGVQGIAPTDAAHWILLASAGVSGGFFKNIFRRFATQPTTPVGANPSGWADAPPAANGQPLWMVLGLHDNDNSFIGPWSSPSEIGGSGVEVEYSSNASAWHPVFLSSDIYMRQRIAGGAWSAAIRIVGEKGEDGTAGAAWHSGSSAPSSGLGNAGDYYYRTSTGDIYLKTGSGTWSVDGNIKGNDGDRWHSGTGIPSGSLGKQGDLYLRTTTNQIYEKTGSSTWTLNFALTDSLGALASLDNVGTNQIQLGAVTKGNHTRDPELRTATNGVTHEIAAIDVSNQTTDSTPFLVTAEVILAFVGGVSNVTLNLEHNGSTSGLMYIRGDRCSNGAKRYTTSNATVLRYSGLTSSTFKMTLRASSETTGAYVQYQHAGLTAIATKR